MKWTLIYFDDQIQNIECISDLLSEEFNVVGSNDPSKFPELLEDNYPHVILMDVHMPGMDGHALYQKISTHPFYNECPVIFISGDQSDENKLKSLEGGGIDFIPRDISTDEVVARIKNKVRYFLERSTHLNLGNLDIDIEMMRASIGEENIDLTILEFRMLSCILRNYPKFLTRSELIQKAWGNTNVKPGTVNTHLTNLKPKIESWDYQIKVREESITVKKKEKI